MTIYISLPKFKFEAPTPIMPAPIRAPTIVCVPEIGMPINDESKVNPNVDIY